MTPPPRRTAWFRYAPAGPDQQEIERWADEHWAESLHLEHGPDGLLRGASFSGWRGPPPERSPSGVVQAVAQETGVQVSRIRSVERTRDVANARAIAAYVLRRLFALSLPEVGKELDRDHTTVLYAIRRVEREPEMRLVALRILADLETKEA